MPTTDPFQIESRLWLEYLDARRTPLTEANRLMHRTLCDIAPERYAELLADRASALSHKREVLANMLRAPSGRSVPAQRLSQLLSILSIDEQLGVLDVVVARRIDSRRACTLLLSRVIGNEQLPALAANHRMRVIRLLKHALGERTWSAIKAHLASPTPEGEAQLNRRMLAYAVDPVLAREALAFLAGTSEMPTVPLLAQRVAARKDIEAGAGMPRETLFGLRGIYHPDVPANRIRVLSAVVRTNEHRDGPLTALYKDAFLAATPGPALAMLPAHLHAACEGLPVLEAHVALIVDLSASAASSGERAYHPAALGLALARILESRVQRVSVLQVGGQTDGDGLPRPAGATDLASAMLVAAQDDPQVMLIVSDGYENVRPGDSARVAEGLRALRRGGTIYHVVPLFASGEDLVQRQLGAPIVTIPVQHEDDVRELLARILLAAGATQPAADAALVQQLVVAAR